MKLYFCDITDDHAEITAFVESLPKREQERLNQYNTLRRGEKAAGLMLIHRAAEEMNTGGLSMRKGKYGKPYACAENGTFCFNISHSHGRVVLAADDQPVGVDIEYVRDVDLDITRKFATQEETAYILAGEDRAEQLRRFFTLWTLKEACVKAEGKGFRIPLRQVEFTVDGDRVACSRRRWEFETFITPDGFAVSTAGRVRRPETVFSEEFDDAQ